MVFPLVSFHHKVPSQFLPPVFIIPLFLKEKAGSEWWIIWLLQAEFGDIIYSSLRYCCGGLIEKTPTSNVERKRSPWLVSGKDFKMSKSQSIRISWWAHNSLWRFTGLFSVASKVGLQSDEPTIWFHTLWYLLNQLKVNMPFPHAFLIGREKIFNYHSILG